VTDCSLLACEVVIGAFDNAGTCMSPVRNREECKGRILEKERLEASGFERRK
jgi:hypothetical protein